MLTAIGKCQAFFTKCDACCNDYYDACEVQLLHSFFRSSLSAELVRLRNWLRAHPGQCRAIAAFLVTLQAAARRLLAVPEHLRTEFADRLSFVLHSGGPARTLHRSAVVRPTAGQTGAVRGPLGPGWRFGLEATAGAGLAPEFDSESGGDEQSMGDRHQTGLRVIR